MDRIIVRLVQIDAKPPHYFSMKPRNLNDLDHIVFPVALPLQIYLPDPIPESMLPKI